ncbi:hypothetical protein K501DRAFT_280320 [Backusella circina FSU 941]|nr:hypothetical protein K501DRAFT_280320 [Backusella circina FSU 941]
MTKSCEENVPVPAPDAKKSEAPVALAATATTEGLGNEQLESAQVATSVVLPIQAVAPVALETTLISATTEGQGTQLQVDTPVTPVTVWEERPPQSEATVALATTATAEGLESPQRASTQATAWYTELGVRSPHPESTEAETAAPAATLAQTDAAVGLRNQTRQESAPSVTTSGVHIGNQYEESTTATPTSSVSEMPRPTPEAPVANGTGSGIGLKRSTSSSSLSWDKRRKIEGPVSPREYSSEQVAESSAAAIARSMRVSESPAVEAVGNTDVEMADVTHDNLSGLPPFPLADLFGAETAPPGVAPASPRAVDAAEAMLDLAWVQPVPTPLPAPASLSLTMTSLPPPPPPPQPQQTTADPSGEMEAAQAMLNLWSLPMGSVPSPDAATSPPSPRTMEAAEGLLDSEYFYLISPS